VDRLEFVPQLHIIVDLAVVREPGRSVRRPHRLRTGGTEIEDGEPLVGDDGGIREIPLHRGNLRAAGAGIEMAKPVPRCEHEQALVVRPAVALQPAGRLDVVEDGRRMTHPHPSDEPAH
jgi:hypothetical protein